MGSKLVPYDSDSSSDERTDRERIGDDKVKKDDTKDQNRKPKPSRCDSPQGLIVTTKAMHHTWTVSKENSGPLLSPSLNGDTNKKLKEKEERRGDEKSLNTSVSTMSPLSDRSEVTAPGASGPPDSTGPAAQAGRPVFEERREERKRALEATEDMDRGRTKKIKKFQHYNRFNNNRNGYNPFQEKQNKLHWGSNFEYLENRRPGHHFNKHNSNKYKRFNRYSSGQYYQRHH